MVVGLGGVDQKADDCISKALDIKRQEFDSCFPVFHCNNFFFQIIGVSWSSCLIWEDQSIIENTWEKTSINILNSILPHMEIQQKIHKNYLTVVVLSIMKEKCGVLWQWTNVPITRSGELGRNGDMMFYCGLKDKKVFADSRKEIGTAKTKNMGQLKN